VHTLTKEERVLVKDAYATAVATGKSAAACYIAAIDALHRRYPDAKRAVIANRAVSAVTDERSLMELALRA
jgi:hypothetical protein